MLNKFPVAVVDFKKEKKKHLEHCKTFRATYKSQSCH